MASTKQAQMTCKSKTADELAMSGSEQSQTTRNVVAGTRTTIKQAESFNTLQTLQHRAVSIRVSNEVLIDVHIFDKVTCEPGRFPPDEDTLDTNGNGGGSINAPGGLSGNSEESCGIANGITICEDCIDDGLGHSSNINMQLRSDSDCTTRNATIENRRVDDLLYDTYHQSMQLHDTAQPTLDTPSSPAVHPTLVTPARLPPCIDHFWSTDWTSDMENDDDGDVD